MPAPTPAPTPERCRGLTLIEVVVSAAIFAAVIWFALSVVLSGSGIFQSVTNATTAEDTARHALERVVIELRSSGAAMLDPLQAPQGSTTLTYQKALGFDGTAILWGNPRQVVLQLDPGETDDGTDEDGDGLVDERELVLVQDLGLPSQSTRVLVRNVAELAEGEQLNGADDNGNLLVDEPGFTAQVSGRTVTLRLSIERRDDDGTNTVRSAQATLTMEN